MNPEDDLIALARGFLDGFSATPFADLRAALVEADSFDDAVERLGGDPFAKYLSEIVDPRVQVEVDFPGAEILTGGSGRDAFWRFWSDWLEPWDDLRISASNFTREANHVFIDFRVEAEGGRSGASVELEGCQAWTFQNGKLVGYAIYPDRAKAMAIKYEGG